MSATPLLHIAGLTASVDEKTILPGIDLAVQAPVEIPGVPLSSFLRAQIAGRPGLEMNGKEFRRLL